MRSGYNSLLFFKIYHPILLHNAKHSKFVFYVYVQVYSGGIGSYALLAMLIAFLKVKVVT